MSCKHVTNGICNKCLMIATPGERQGAYIDISGYGKHLGLGGQKMKRTYTKDWCQGLCTKCGFACADYCEDYKELEEENEKLQAERNRYRAALEKILETGCCDACSGVERVAKEALEGK